MTNDAIKQAILLVSYELIITSVFLFLILKVPLITGKRKETNVSNETLKLKGNSIIYFMLILLAFLLYVTIGRSMNLVSFFTISVESGERFGDLDSTFEMLLRQIIIVASVYLFVWVTSVCKRKYNITGNKKYVMYSLLVGLLNVGIIVGERRSAQIYTGIVVVFVLINSFSKYKKQIILIIGITTITIILFMSIYKHLYAFTSGSYLQALSESELDLQFWAQNFQAYFFGTQTVASQIDLRRVLDVNVFNFFYDIMRSTFGLNFMLKDVILTVSQMYNDIIYNGFQLTGHVLSGVGYGYIIFGPLLAPVVVVVNILISLFFEKIYNATNSIELKYIYGYVLIRSALSISASTPAVVNIVSLMLVTSGIVYVIALIFRRNQVNVIKYKKNGKVKYENYTSISH